MVESSSSRGLASLLLSGRGTYFQLPCRAVELEADDIQVCLSTTGQFILP